MKENKLQTITNLFEGNAIRSIWDAEQEDYYFSVVDVIGALTESQNASDYWTTLKRRLKNDEKSELTDNIIQLKMKSRKDDKSYPTDTLNTKRMLRLIESVPSPNTEPFKVWLSQVGSDARKSYEKATNKSAITNKNALNYQYVGETK